MMYSFQGKSTLIMSLFGCLLAIGGSGAQQNGEVMVSTLSRGQSYDRNEDGARFIRDSNPDSMKVQYVNVNGQPVLVQFTYVGPPKILPIATADSYPEGTTINLMCTISGGLRRGLSLNWKINGEDFNIQRLRDSYALENVSIGSDDSEISILKIRNATSGNSGLYTCTAKNSLGQDSTSVRIVVNVDLKWNKVPKNVEVGLNQELSIECDAIGSPPPTIEWLQHVKSVDSSSNSNGTKLVSKGRLLKIAKAHHKDSGLYECIAKNGVSDDIRKVIEVKVRGK